MNRDVSIFFFFLKPGPKTNKFNEKGKKKAQPQGPQVDVHRVSMWVSGVSISGEREKGVS
jgi:hypothetical protein